MATHTWGHDSHALLTLEQAWDLIASEVQPLPGERIPIAEAQDRFLAESITADEDFPPFDKALMDGFAIRSGDCAPPGADLQVLGLMAAGDIASMRLRENTAIRINTGAPLPEGADCVIRLEDTAPSPDNARVRIMISARSGMNFAPRASICHKGDLILRHPIRLGAAQLAAVATAGKASVVVAQRVGVGIVATGDELVPPGAARRPGQIHECNGLMLSSLARQFGAVPDNLGIARDDMDDLKSRLAAAMKQPVVLAAGGMSMGTLDLVPKAFEELGVTWRFHGVEMRPGKPVAYGRGPAGQHVIGLPGNPVSSFVCSWLFVRMIVRALSGLPPAPPKSIQARLTSAWPAARDSRPAFIPALVRPGPDGLIVEPVAWGGSGDPYGLALANALLIRRKPHEASPTDSVAEVIPLDDLAQ